MYSHLQSNIYNCSHYSVCIHYSYVLYCSIHNITMSSSVHHYNIITTIIIMKSLITIVTMIVMEVRTQDPTLTNKNNIYICITNIFFYVTVTTCYNKWWLHMVPSNYNKHMNNHKGHRSDNVYIYIYDGYMIWFHLITITIWTTIKAIDNIYIWWLH